MPKEKLFDPEDALEKAMNVFWEKGYNGTSINDLVEATGLSRSSLYATYEDKHKLFVLALKHYQSNQNKWLTNELAKHSSPKKKLETIFRAYMERVLKDKPGKGCLMINTATEMTNQSRDLAAIASKDFEGMESLLINLIKEGQSLGEIDKNKKPKAVAHFLFANYLGMRLIAQTNPERSMLENIVKQTVLALD